MRVLIVGSGEVGSALAAECVAQGDQVVAIRRSAPPAEAPGGPGVEWIRADVTEPGFQRPAGRFDAVVFLATPRRDEPLERWPAVWGAALEALLKSLEPEPPKRFVLVSCVEVYGQRDGSLVKESSPAEPVADWARAMRDGERMALAASARGIPTLILRLAEVYGPGRLERMHRFIRNEVVIPGRGDRYLNMIHRDDAVAALRAALRNGRPGEIYNVVDDEPVTVTHFYTWMSETLGKWMPRSGPDTGGEAASAGSTTHRRVSNRRLTMELGCRLRYANFRLGYTAEIKALTDAGQLEIEPEAR